MNQKGKWNPRSQPGFCNNLPSTPAPCRRSSRGAASIATCGDARSRLAARLAPCRLFGVPTLPRPRVTAGDFALAEADAPDPKAGKILIRNRNLSRDPGQRRLMDRECVPCGRPRTALVTDRAHGRAGDCIEHVGAARRPAGLSPARHGARYPRPTQTEARAGAARAVRLWLAGGRGAGGTGWGWHGWRYPERA